MLVVLVGKHQGIIILGCRGIIMEGFGWGIGFDCGFSAFALVLNLYVIASSTGNLPANRDQKDKFKDVTGKQA